MLLAALAWPSPACQLWPSPQVNAARFWLTEQEMGCISGESILLLPFSSFPGSYEFMLTNKHFGGKGPFTL